MSGIFTPASRHAAQHILAEVSAGGHSSLVNASKVCKHSRLYLTASSCEIPLWLGFVRLMVQLPSARIEGEGSTTFTFEHQVDSKD
jgi:hypothetical protein